MNHCRSELMPDAKTSPAPKHLSHLAYKASASTSAAQGLKNFKAVGDTAVGLPFQLHFNLEIE